MIRNFIIIFFLSSTLSLQGIFISMAHLCQFFGEDTKNIAIFGEVPLFINGTSNHTIHLEQVHRRMMFHYLQELASSRGTQPKKIAVLLDSSSLLTNDLALYNKEKNLEKHPNTMGTALSLPHYAHANNNKLGSLDCFHVHETNKDILALRQTLKILKNILYFIDHSDEDTDNNHFLSINTISKANNKKKKEFINTQKCFFAQKMLMKIAPETTCIEYLATLEKVTTLLEVRKSKYHNSMQQYYDQALSFLKSNIEKSDSFLKEALWNAFVNHKLSYLKKQKKCWIKPVDEFVKTFDFTEQLKGQLHHYDCVMVFCEHNTALKIKKRLRYFTPTKEYGCKGKINKTASSINCFCTSEAFNDIFQQIKAFEAYKEVLCHQKTSKNTRNIA